MGNTKNENLKPSFWAVIPATVRYDEVVGSTAKLLFAEITALSNLHGYCWASNLYFSNLFKISVTQVSRLIKSLEDRGFIKSEIDAESGNQRKLYATISVEGVINEPKGKTFEDRFDELIGQVSEAEKEERQKFIDYFTATNDGGKKQHWQKQKTFAMRQRWATWKRNARDWAKPKFEKLPSDKELRENAKREAERKGRETETEKAMREASKPRTAEEQARIDKRLADMRANLKVKFIMPK